MESKKKKTNVFIKTSDAFTCWDLPDERFAKLMRAVIMYSCDGTTPDDFDPELATMFKFFKTTADNYTTEYERTCERNSQNASKGGGNPNFRKGQPNPYYKRDNQTLTEITEDNREITDINKINEINQKDRIGLDRIGEDRIGEDGMFSNENDINNSSIASNATSKVPSDAGQDSARLAHKKSETVRDVVEYYNAKVRETGAKLRFCNTMADQRRSWILARVDEHGMGKVMQMIDKACASRFLNYDATNAPVSIDWLFRPNNFPKVLDGNFDNRDRASPPSPPPKEQMKSPIPEYSNEEWNALPFWEQDDAIHKHYGLD